MQGKNVQPHVSFLHCYYRLTRNTTWDAAIHRYWQGISAHNEGHPYQYHGVIDNYPELARLDNVHIRLLLYKPYE